MCPAGDNHHNFLTNSGFCSVAMQETQTVPALSLLLFHQIVTKYRPSADDFGANLMTKSPVRWRYEVIAMHPDRSEPTLLDGADFIALDADNAKLVLARVVGGLQPSGATRPHAIRLLDGDGREVWRGLLSGPRPDRRERVAASVPAP
jgi:hypothetical protein